MAPPDLKDLHTFVILAYKESNYLESCIHSLLSQSIPSKIIISTSTPNAHIRSLSEQYDLPLRINPEQKGLAADWTFALKTADTRYVSLAHQDDLYFSSYTEKFLRAALQNQDILIAFSNYVEMDERFVKPISLLLMIKKLLLIPFFFNKVVSSKAIKRLIVSFGSPLCCPSVMFNKERLGSFSFDSSFRINADWEAWLRLSLIRGGFLYVDQRLVAHRIHSEAETTLGLKSNFRQLEDRRLFEKLYPSPLSDLMRTIYSLSYRFNTG